MSLPLARRRGGGSRRERREVFRFLDQERRVHRYQSPSPPQSGLQRLDPFWKSSNLLRCASLTDLAPIRKRVETWGECELHLARAVRVHQKKLELTSTPHSPVEHDFFAVG